MKKIIVLDGYTENPGDLSWKGMEKYGVLTVYERTPEEEIIERILDAEIIFTNKTPITAKTFQACPNIRYVGVLATGYNVVDIAAAKSHGVTVTNVPTYGTAAVAQFAIALLLELCHRIGYHSDAVKQGRWSNCADFCFWDFPLIELSGKTMGIIGYGRIGQKTAEIAKAFGMKTIAYNKTMAIDKTKICSMVSLEELLVKSDIISLHCPLLPETQGMINLNSISKMKDGIFIINTSRGGLINEHDLADALNSGKVGGAAVDVASVEPIKNDNPLLYAKNCIITPHIAWASKESRQRLMDIAIENLAKYLDGEPINVVTL